MLNSPTPGPLDPTPQDIMAQEQAIDEIVRAGPWGAIALAGTATTIVIALWFAFFFMIFLPRGTIQ